MSLQECFEFKKSGMQTKRNHLVYATSELLLKNQIDLLVVTNDLQRDELFNSTTMNMAAEAQAIGWDKKFSNVANYRPLDRRYHYCHPKFNDRIRPDLLRAWGEENICLYSLPAGTRDGPAVWCYGSVPDYDAFRGSYGGYAFPLWDRRGGPEVHNLNAILLAGLTAAYGKNITPAEVFDCILCLLSAKSYSLDFAEDLEDVFPHVPFPAQHKTFLEAATLGAEIRAVETFARPPSTEFLPASLCRFSTPPKGKIINPSYADGSFEFCEHGAGKATGISADIWHYSVSGYELLPRWIRGREGLEVDLSLATELRDICGRIAEMIDLSAKADKILTKTLKNVLGRAALGLVPATSE